MPDAPNLVGTRDFLANCHANGPQCRQPNMLDGLDREGLSIEVDSLLPAERVAQSLNQIIEWRDRPLTIRGDNRPENVSAKMTKAEKQGITMN